MTNYQDAQLGDEVEFRGARASVYEATDDYIKVELLEDTPVFDGADLFAAMVLRNPQDGMVGGSKGDLFKIHR